MKKTTITPKRIRKIRGDFTRKEFGHLLKVSDVAVYWWESGKVRPNGPARIVLGMLAGRARAWTLDWLRRNGSQF